MNINKSEGKKSWIPAGLFFLLVILATVYLGSTSLRRPAADSTSVAVVAAGPDSMIADIDTANLSPLQLKILDIVKSEYAKAPASYDETVLQYTEGFEESWCADFISWVLNEAGSPNLSSETGYWRIPGVLSLQTYYKEMDGYKTVDDSYVPQLGDAAFYIGQETPDAKSSEHVAFVLSYDGNTLVTVGGNEGDDGTLRVRSETLDANKAKGLVGFGVLE